MARTIGKAHINAVKMLTKKAFEDDVDDISTEVHSKIPDSVYDIWEGAYSEIEYYINETIME